MARAAPHRLARSERTLPLLAIDQMDKHNSIWPTYNTSFVGVLLGSLKDSFVPAAGTIKLFILAFGTKIFYVLFTQLCIDIRDFSLNTYR